jgi:putative PIN family toxin of toxin-antitoxin system
MTKSTRPAKNFSMKAVVDTNVIIAGLLNPHGTPAAIVNAIISGKIQLLYDDRMFGEYSSVMRRRKFGFPDDTVDDFLYTVKITGSLVVPAYIPIQLPDPHDRCFVECARESGCEILITGNKRHFPAAVCKGIKVFSPGEFFEAFGKAL